MQSDLNLGSYFQLLYTLEFEQDEKCSPYADLTFQTC